MREIPSFQFYILQEISNIESLSIPISGNIPTIVAIIVVGATFLLYLKRPKTTKESQMGEFPFMRARRDG
jgi:membrane-bound acyltransferase YfiQ involved in biofilm formation